MYSCVAVPLMRPDCQSVDAEACIQVSLLVNCVVVIMNKHVFDNLLETPMVTLLMTASRLTEVKQDDNRVLNLRHNRVKWN